MTDTPGPVMNLEATDIKQTSTMLSWSPPEVDGGSEVTHYVVEKREIDRKTWAMVKAEVEMDKVPFKVSGLMPGTEYYFRVTAVNQYGPGVPRVSPTSYLASDPVSTYNFFLCSDGRGTLFFNSTSKKTLYYKLQSYRNLLK